MWRRLRRRFLIFKRLSMGTKSFFLFDYNGISEIMMGLEKEKQTSKKEDAHMKALLEQEMLMDEEEAKKPLYLRLPRKLYELVFGRTAPTLPYDMPAEEDSLSLGSSASSDHRSPFSRSGVSFRERMRRLMKHPRFDQVILLCIAVSSLLMIINTPLSDPRKEPDATIFYALDWVFGIIFTLEMLTKMIAMGVIVNNNPSPEQFAEMQDELAEKKEKELEEEQREKDKAMEEERLKLRGSSEENDVDGEPLSLAAARGNAVSKPSAFPMEKFSESVKIAAPESDTPSVLPGGVTTSSEQLQQHHRRSSREKDPDVDVVAGEEAPGLSNASGSTTSSLCAILYDTEYQTPYMTDPWNILDFIVVCVAWIELTQILDGGSFLKVLRLFRTLRPLRMISRNPNLKLVVTTLFKSFPQLVTLCVFGGFMLLLFGVFATSYLKGALSECKGSDGGAMEFFNSTCRDAFCNDERPGFCVDRDNYDFVTYARYPSGGESLYLHRSFANSTSADAYLAAGSSWEPEESGGNLPTLVDFRDNSFWSTDRMCYEQLRYAFFEPQTELTVGNASVLGAANLVSPPALSSLQKSDLLYVDEDSDTKAFVAQSYNESFWQITYPDAAVREQKIMEEIQRRYRPLDRLPEDSPLCVVNCAEVGSEDSELKHPFCVDSELKQDSNNNWYFDKNIWGHRVLPCSSCQANFCGESGSARSRSDCEYQCDGPEYYNLFCTKNSCKNTNEQNSPTCQRCKQECIAQCRCPDKCMPHLDDAKSCILAEGRWWTVVPGMGFDNILQAAFTLFQVITTEGWVVIMLAVVDQNGIYKDPERDSGEYWVIFFWVYSLVGYFFLANVVIGVIIDNFNQMKRDAMEDTSEQKVLSEAQHRWLQCQKVFYATRSFFLITNVESLPPGQRGLFFFVASKKFESFIMGVIVLNIFAMAFRVNPEPTNSDDLSYALNSCINPINLFCLIVFNVEFVLKFTAYKWGYFSDWWNRFDFSCVLSSNVGYVLEQLQVGDTGSLSIIRMFRVIRLFRLVRFLQGLNQLSGAFLLSIPKLGNVSAILGLVLLIFALLGMNLFSPFLMLDSFEAYGPSTNFLTFWDSMLMLLRCMTGEAWNSIMADLATEKFQTQSILEQPCVDEMSVTKSNYPFLESEGFLKTPIQCGDSKVSYVFFTMFIVSVFFIVLNLFIAVIFEGFEESRQLQVGNMIQLAMDIWSEYDPNYELILPVDHAITFVGEVLQKAGLQSDEDDDMTLAERRVKMMRSYALQVTPTGDTHFLWCCQAILRKLIVQNSPELEKQLEELDADTSGALVTKTVIEMREQRIEQTRQTAQEFIFKGKKFGLERYDARLSISLIQRGIRRARVRLRKRKHDAWQAALNRLTANMDINNKRGGLLATKAMYSKTAMRLRHIILQDAKVFDGIRTAFCFDACLQAYGINRYEEFELEPTLGRRVSHVTLPTLKSDFYRYIENRKEVPRTERKMFHQGPPIEAIINPQREENKVLLEEL